MKPNRYQNHLNRVFGMSIHCGVSMALGFVVLMSWIEAEAGDILRGGATATGAKPRPGANGGAPTPAATDAARANARDSLARTTRTVDAMRAMQQAARDAARKGPNQLSNPLAKPPVTLPVVPNGLVTGGLKVSPLVSTDPTKWAGAELPRQTVEKGKTKVTIKQTEQQALLSWESFNVGKETTLNFDQSKGGEDSGKWIAFNMVKDATANPTQILGNITADGQIYVINTNGIIFGGSSQVNARSLTVSSLPINGNLISQGLLNNPDAQFLFSTLPVPGGSGGTPDFTPEAAPATGYGDVIVQEGAILKSPAAAGGNGGRIMLVGPNVENRGTILSPSGQTILAAGLQVGIAAHNSSDPSLRGLDAWVGAVDETSGNVTNAGIIEAYTGSVLAVGRNIQQNGAIDSSTSVNLNGRIDLKASYGAVANPNFDTTTELGAGGPLFFNQFTGTVTLGKGSSTRILPDYLSMRSVPGTALPENSQVNLEGLTLTLAKDAVLFAPNGDVSMRAGLWPYKDVDGNRSILGVDGTPESGLSNYFSGSNQRFFFGEGDIHFDSSSLVSVAGSVDVFIPLAHKILEVELRGPELADSPLQRENESIRGIPLTVDIGKTGTYNGKFWVGTPLGDVTGLAGLIERNAAQLTVSGGDITLQAGSSVVIGETASVDVSGGFSKHEGGSVKTSVLVSNGRLIPIESATPDIKYDGMLDITSTTIDPKWGVSAEYAKPFLQGVKHKSYLEGGAAGTLSITAPQMTLDGNLRGVSLAGPKQLSAPPTSGTLELVFESDKIIEFSGSIQYIRHSPTAPNIVFTDVPRISGVSSLSMTKSGPQLSLPVRFAGDNGFGNLSIHNPDGAVTLPAGVELATSADGSVSLAAANVTVLGKILAPGGGISLSAFNLSPSGVVEYQLFNPAGSAPLPDAVEGRGMVILGAGAKLSAAGRFVDDSIDPLTATGGGVIDAGSVSIRSYEAKLAAGSVIDVSGGAYVSAIRKVSYGKGGSISILTGRDPSFSAVTGGGLVLGSELLGYSGSAGGTLALQSGLIRIGDNSVKGALNLDESFFRKGGFTKYSLTGIGSVTGLNDAGMETYSPAVSIADGARINSVAGEIVAIWDPVDGGYDLKRYIPEQGLRSPVSLSFAASNTDDPFTLDKLEIRGDIVMGEGSLIATDPGGAVSFSAGTVAILGGIVAPGGSITIKGASSFPLTQEQRLRTTSALATVYLSSTSRLLTEGTTVLVPDAYGRRVGSVLDGGDIAISGNIIAEAGSRLDVSGASGLLDLDPSSVSNPGLGGEGTVPNSSGLVTIRTRIDSDGGTIDLDGSQILFSDATLSGRAGGLTANGGSLLVSSGRYYQEGVSRTGADINLVVRQSGDVLLTLSNGVGLAPAIAPDMADPNAGFLALERFANGGFSSLSLGGKYNAAASPIRFGGNVEFRGTIELAVPGFLRLAAGGVVRAEDSVAISASRLQIGQDFLEPLHPEDVYAPFFQDPASPSAEYKFAPTFGTGSLSFRAGLIDIGTLSLQNIGNASFASINGDIRGNGTVSVAGNLVLEAARIYPTTLTRFDVFAYSHEKVEGSIEIRKSGSSPAPFSAGGSIGLYADTILQGGVLHAPLGAIRLGWSGSVTDQPVDIIAGTSIAPPVTSQVILGEDSITSVSAKGLKIPFGNSPDGLTWIDPRGVNVTISGLPRKSVVVDGDSVQMDSSAVIDIRGGGDLFATRWVPGNGGSIDLLGSPGSEWGSGAGYEPGDLVTYKGETWSARVRHSGQAPGSNLYWTKVAQSFAIIPSYQSGFAPYNPYNTGGNSASLGGNPGYVDGSLKVGDTITLEGSSVLPAGSYTLLPRGYASLKGALLVTLSSTQSVGSLITPEGAAYVSGYVSNGFNPTASEPSQRSRFEIAPASVVAARALYSIYSANVFIPKAGGNQPLPNDAGSLSIHGGSALSLEGVLNAQAAGRGAMVDISTSADIFLTKNGGIPSTGMVFLSTDVLGNWGAESLLIGGLRDSEGDSGTLAEVRTSSITLDNAGASFTGSDIILASKESITLAEGSTIRSLGESGVIAPSLLIEGDGALVRVSDDPLASISRDGVTGSSAGSLVMGDSAVVRGSSVTLDSSNAMSVSPEAVIKGESINLSSGQISVVFDGVTGFLDGSVVDNHLALTGTTLESIQNTGSLRLLSYSSIDFYGGGQLGGGALDSITFSAGAMRGFRQGIGEVSLNADAVRFENALGAVAPADASTFTGELNVLSESITLGGNDFKVSGFKDFSLTANDHLAFEGKGLFSTIGNLSTDTPLISGSTASIYQIHAGGKVSLLSSGASSEDGSGLGASLAIRGSSVVANTDIYLPSGSLSLTATNGPVQVGGRLSVEGSSATFEKLVRHSNAGSIVLQSANADVILARGGELSVSAATGGGEAGRIDIAAPAGTFVNDGSLSGQESGSFVLDAGFLAESGKGSFDGISKSLDQGGFETLRSFRVRSGDVVINGNYKTQEFNLSTDLGSITVNGSIDASGATGGSISLASWFNLTLADGSRLDASGADFNSAGKGGSILLEAGTQRDGFANTLGMLDIQSGSSIDLSVATYQAGSWREVGSSAYNGKFTGTLHLRAPRTAANNDLNVAAIGGDIKGASSIVVEGYKTYSPTGGILDIALRETIHQDSIAFLGAAGTGNANEAVILSRLLNGRDASSAFGRTLVISPGVEIINSTGDLVLGLANNTSAGSTNPEALAAADWDLSGFRYGSRGAAGVLTMRASGDLVFNNTLSDGFTPVSASDSDLWQKGHSGMWLASLSTIREELPVNTQSWSYRLTAGADVNASNFRSVQTLRAFEESQPSRGSIIVGEYYDAVPNSISSGISSGIGSEGQTADTIRISITTENKGNRFEVIRTGTGNITLHASRDVQLRNLFSSIYTAGVALPEPGTIATANDFLIPVIPVSEGDHPDQTGGFGVTLGAVQQLTQPTWSMAGGNISVHAGNNIGRYTLVNGALTVDSSRQLPNNWLYRRGHVDSSTGLFAPESGFGTRPDVQNAENIHDTSPSTAWWIDFSNFFQGVGALGGGNVALAAGNDVINVDAVTPTNARMPGRLKNPGYVAGSTTKPEFINVRPNEAALHELGGGDVTVTAGHNIDGGIYYVERGKGTLFAGGSITTNASRTPSLGLLDASPALDPLTWLPTTLFVGKSHFDVAARGDVLLGPVTNPFLLPQGINNKFWYKTYFNTYSADAGVNVSSYGGSVTHRLAVNLPDSANARSVLAAWIGIQNLFTGESSAFNASNFQPWLRLAELDLSTFAEVFTLGAPNLRSTSFSGDLNLVGDMTLFPSSQGQLELAAAGGILGLQPAGQGTFNGSNYQVWTYANVNLSDADPDLIAGVSTPLAYQTVVGGSRNELALSSSDVLQQISLSLRETGSTTGFASTNAVKEALHDSDILHRNDPNPVRIHAVGGDITGITLFSPKETLITAENDISDVSFYLQNTDTFDVSLISAGGNIIPFGENSETRTVAADVDAGNLIGDPQQTTAAGGSTNALAGDIQINGPGVLEVLAGRNIDLGTGANFKDGTGVGITSLGNLRNPNLSFAGADLIVLAGTAAADGVGAAAGLASSVLDFDAFIAKYFADEKVINSSEYLNKLGYDGDFEDLDSEQQAVAAFGKFYQILRDAGRKYGKTGKNKSYKAGYDAIETLFGEEKPEGEILTRAREIRTITGGSISLAAPGGGVTMASSIFGNPLTPPGVVTEYGGTISTFTDGSVDIGQARVFTLRGGDIVMWASHGDIAAGTSPKTVVTAPPTRVVIDVSSANVQTDLGGLATGGGIGVLAAVEGVKAGSVDLIAPRGTVDAGDAGISATGNLNIAAQTVLNSSNIAAGGSVSGAAPAAVSAPSVSTTVAASNATAGTTSAVPESQPSAPAEVTPTIKEEPSIFTVEVFGYGGGSDSDADEEDEEDEGDGEENP